MGCGNNQWIMIIFQFTAEDAINIVISSNHPLLNANGATTDLGKKENTGKEEAMSREDDKGFTEVPHWRKPKKGKLNRNHRLRN